MRTPDTIAVVYFAYIAVAAVTVRDVPVRRRVRVAGLAAAAIAVVFLTTRVWTLEPVLQNWLPVLWLLLGYWLPGGLLHEPMPGLEAWLRASDRWIQDWPSMRWARTPPGWASAILELAYFVVHLFVPAGLAVLLLDGLDASDSFWTPILLAGYACYGTLPWLQARPPRLVEPTPAASAEPAPRRVRRWNEHVLNTLSVRANTFPSGHVAVALVVALVVLDLEPAAGLVFLPIALLIATATVVRRYHYTADVALGALVAIVCWAAARG